MTCPLSILNLLLDLEERNATHVSMVSTKPGFAAALHFGFLEVRPTGFVGLTRKGLDLLLDRNQLPAREAA